MSTNLTLERGRASIRWWRKGYRVVKHLKEWQLLINQLPSASPGNTAIVMITLIFIVGFITSGLISLFNSVVVAYVVTGSALIGVSWFFFRRTLNMEALKHVRNWLLIVILIVLYIAAFLLSGMEFQPGNIGAVANDGLSILIKASWEEIIFRGVLFAWFIHRPTLRRVLVIGGLSNTLFTAAHVFNFQTSSQADTYCVLVFFQGIVLYLLYLFTQNLIFSAALHTMLNTTNGFFVTVVGPLGSSSSLIVISTVLFSVVGLAWLVRWQEQKRKIYLQQVR